MLNKKYRIAIVGLIIAGLVAFVVFSDQNKGQTSDGTNGFDGLAQIIFVNYDGKEISLEQFRGKPLVINSWAVWCPFCRQELPDLAQLQEELKDSVTVIAIDRRESLSKAKGYTDDLGITGDMLFLLDQSDAFYRSIGGFSMPETIFVESDGEVVVHKRGLMDLDEMREHAQKIL
jgi:thiol-disulfide isomerase/thioredoxin